MPTLARCDPARPLHVSASVDEFSDEPAFVELAQLHGDDAYRRIATPRGEPLQIAPPGAAALLDAIRARPWGLAFQESLETNNGEPLLTALIPHEVASAMLRHIVSQGGDAARPVTDLTTQLAHLGRSASGPVPGSESQPLHVTTPPPNRTPC